MVTQHIVPQSAQVSPSQTISAQGSRDCQSARQGGYKSRHSEDATAAVPAGPEVTRCIAVPRTALQGGKARERVLMAGDDGVLAVPGDELRQAGSCLLRAEDH